MKRKWIGAILLVMVWLMAGCSGSTAEPPTPAEEAESDEPTTQATNTPKPEPTAVPTEIPTIEAEEMMETAEEAEVVEVIESDPSQPIELERISQFNSTSILPALEGDSWEGTLVAASAVVYHDGLFHMLYSDAQDGWPPSAILTGYATSPDGIEWTLVGDEPVFSAADVPYEDYAVNVSMMLLESDGTWVIYFDTVEGDLFGRATAPSPAGPWTADPEPILEPDPGSWDEHGIVSPSVVKVADEYYMYYASFLSEANNPHMAIGMATSADGISWTKYNDPETADPLYQISDPVLEEGPEGSWDFYKVDVPRVVYTPEDGWIMFYRTDKGSNNWNIRSAYGVAISDDGINWQRRQDTPVLAADMSAYFYTVWGSVLLYHEDTYYFWVQSDGNFRGTKVQLATYSGSFR